MNAPRYTSADLDALSDLVGSPGYKLFRDRVESELERRRTELERQGDAGECRGRVAALRTVLGIPEILRSEMKNTIVQDEKDGV